MTWFRDNYKPILVALAVAAGGISALCADLSSGSASAAEYIKDFSAISAGLGALIHLWEQH